ncbi:MAG: DUF1761 domain-containing protein [Rhodothermales bacterium]|nr:DUF1761 domain-containing protein [Rhodothermales bacterium]
MESPNYLAVLVAGLVPMFIGFLWYGPLFGKKWMAYRGKTEEELQEEINPPKTYGVTVLMSIITAYVLSHVVWAFGAATGESGLMLGLQAGFWSWLGFVVTTHWNAVAFEAKELGHMILDTAAALVGLLIMGSILALWT